VHSQTTLKEFVDEYDDALRRMVESETRADFYSFKEVHEQFVKMTSCNNSILKSEGAISTFEVIEYVAIGDYLIENTFLVYFNEDELEAEKLNDFEF
jgi:uncharacterized protein YaaR (DUF327 family)